MKSNAEIEAARRAGKSMILDAYQRDLMERGAKVVSVVVKNGLRETTYETLEGRRHTFVRREPTGPSGND